MVGGGVTEGIGSVVLKLRLFPLEWIYTSFSPCENRLLIDWKEWSLFYNKIVDVRI